eukprot:TRINITY_DN1858_c1_g1_i1.p1 TRINITY_DN1858_c1_g1~~TRINITY_DN1858_c1_g1_i1.p1  ORF type:complete len:523 (+),score=104.52 TRINITY_DN1858_c1_g1_i1:961-2529(+)
MELASASHTPSSALIQISDSFWTKIHYSIQLPPVSSGAEGTIYRASILNPEDSNTPRSLCVKRRIDLIDKPFSWAEAALAGDKFAMSVASQTCLINSPLAINLGNSGIDILYPVFFDCDAKVAKEKLLSLHPSLGVEFATYLAKPFVSFVLRTGFFLSSRSWSHNDWKLDNILLSTVGRFSDPKSGFNRLRLSDFGQAMHLPAFKCSTIAARGTERWRAPEQVYTDRQPVLHPNSQTYSMALCILDLLSVHEDVFRGSEKPSTRRAASLVDMLRSNFPFLQKMLDEDPDRRISAIDLIKHDPCQASSDQEVIDSFCNVFDALSTTLGEQATALLGSMKPSEIPDHITSFKSSFLANLDWSKNATQQRRSLSHTDPLGHQAFLCGSARFTAPAAVVVALKDLPAPAPRANEPLLSVMAEFIFKDSRDSRDRATPSLQAFRSTFESLDSPEPGMDPEFVQLVSKIKASVAVTLPIIAEAAKLPVHDARTYVSQRLDQLNPKELVEFPLSQKILQKMIAIFKANM